MKDKKILNDPVHGFISVPGKLALSIIDHPVFQRLRRIKQLGMTEFVYPGAVHSRFHHALGAMHLMGLTLNNLIQRGHFIWDQEKEAAQVAILLHDIGHGPFSHALEHTLLEKVHHEEMSLYIMRYFNNLHGGALELAIRMYQNKYERKFFHQLISSQLDADRMDYLQRDCFYTGVSEGTIGAERILNMMDLAEDRLVLEEKAIYSIENFLTARRLMYWQVYLHKTTVAAEKMIINIIKRARFLVQRGKELPASPSLQVFLEENVTINHFQNHKKYFEAFISLDDYDIWSAIKLWATNQDKILSMLCNDLLNRKLFKVHISSEKPDREKVEEFKEVLGREYSLNKDEIQYIISEGAITNEAYIAKGENINILRKNGEIVDVAQASDLPNIKAISKIVKKYYVCSPKKIYL